MQTASLTGMILLVIAPATVSSRSLLIANIPSVIADGFTHIGRGAIDFLIVSILALIVLGQNLEGIPAILVLAPLVLPIAATFNVNPIHYGIVLITAIGLGPFSPPIGVGLYIACAIGETSVERASRVHAPLQAVLVTNLIRMDLPSADVDCFVFRARRPIFDTSPFVCVGHVHEENPAQVELSTRDAHGDICMSAAATVRPRD